MEILIKNSTVLFEPAASWLWDGWNGEIKLSAEDRGVTGAGDSVGLGLDITSLNTKLAGKQYKGKGFEDIPGAVVSATIVITKSSLSNVVRIGGQDVAHSGTEGTFLVSVSPSFVSGSPPIPDPMIAKNGTWKIKEPGQKIVTST